MMNAPEEPGEPLARWYVVYAKPHREAAAQLHLERKGIEVFYPQLVLPDYANGTRRCVALFPNYLFVQIELSRRYHEVLWSPGIRSFVGSTTGPLPLDDAIIAHLRRNAPADGRLPARLNLAAGQQVEIADGPFAGLSAIIQNPPDARGRIRVLMRLLNRRAVSVQVPARFVKTGWVA
jgi:transcription elongation factor/antiterminator RfaH